MWNTVDILSNAPVATVAKAILAWHSKHIRYKVKPFSDRTRLKSCNGPAYANKLSLSEIYALIAGRLA